MSKRKMPDGYQLVANDASTFRQAITKDKNGQQKTVAVFVHEEAMANQSRRQIPPIVDRLLFPSGLTLLSGNPKSGKSNLVMKWTHEIAAGRDYLAWKTTTPAWVLIVEIEESDRVQERRYQRWELEPDEEDFFDDGRVQILQDPESFVINDTTTTNRFSIDMTTGLGLQIALWASQIPENTPGLVVIDTYTRAMPSDDTLSYAKQSQMMGAVQLLARDLNISVLLVHHTNKNADYKDPFDRISGTNGIKGQVDTMMVLMSDYKENKDDPDAKPRHVGVVYAEGRDCARGDVDRYLHMRPSGFWELDPEAKSTDKLKSSKKEFIPNAVKAVVDFMEDKSEWQGTASDLVEVLPGTYGEIALRRVTRELNANATWLAAHGISVSNSRRGKSGTRIINICINNDK